jgi:hypothetical protein
LRSRATAKTWAITMAVATTCARCAPRTLCPASFCLFLVPQAHTMLPPVADAHNAASCHKQSLTSCESQRSPAVNILSHTMSIEVLQHRTCQAVNTPICICACVCTVLQLPPTATLPWQHLATKQQQPTQLTERNSNPHCSHCPPRRASTCSTRTAARTKS